ncbi:MAG TPA: hypothetical protein VFD39_06070, partial [Trueperaceae bacterium]|nr:hypothetical protein [Trueperaceae bacterium]
LLEPGVYRPGEDAANPVASAEGAPVEAPAASAPVVLASLLSAGESRLPRSGDLLTASTDPRAAAESTGGEPGARLAADEAAAGEAAAGEEPPAEAIANALRRTPAGGAQTTIGIVLLALALATLLVEWALYAGVFDGLARRWRVRSGAAT